MAIKYDALGNMIQSSDTFTDGAKTEALRTIGAGIKNLGREVGGSIKAVAGKAKGHVVAGAGKAKAKWNSLQPHTKGVIKGAAGGVAAGGVGAYAVKKSRDEQDPKFTGVKVDDKKGKKSSFGKKSDKKEKGGNPFAKKGGKPSFGKKDDKKGGKPFGGKSFGGKKADKKGFGGKPAFGKKAPMKDAGLGQSMRKRHVK